MFKGKKFTNQLTKFFDSPFADDKRFAVQYVANLTRDKMSESEEVVKQLFYDKIFPLLIQSKDQDNRLMAFEVICNIIQSDTQRHKLADGQYFARVFEKMHAIADSNEITDIKILDRLSWLVTMISFH